MKILFIVLLGTLAFPAVAQQGVCGKVLWLEGNQMPGPGKKSSPGQGIAREIHIYALVTRENTTENEGFYTEVRSRLVATGKSKKNGSYKIKLPPGKYSVFTKEPGGLFANLYDSAGAINPVTVEEGEFTVLDLSINYKAAF